MRKRSPGVSLVSAGLGVAIVPASIRKLQRERVLYRPLRPATTATEMAIAYHRGSRSMVLQSFLRVVTKNSDR